MFLSPFYDFRHSKKWTEESKWKPRLRKRCGIFRDPFQEALASDDDDGSTEINKLEPCCVYRTKYIEQTLAVLIDRFLILDHRAVGFGYAPLSF